MSVLEKSVYVVVVIAVFTCTFMMPSWIPRGTSTIVEEIASLVGNRFLVLALLLIIVTVASGIAPYFAIQATREHSVIFRALIKMFIIALPAISLGNAASFMLGQMGLYDAASKHLASLAVGTVLYLSGSIGGIVGIIYAPEYWNLYSLSQNTCSPASVESSDDEQG